LKNCSNKARSTIKPVIDITLTIQFIKNRVVLL